MGIAPLNPSYASPSRVLIPRSIRVTAPYRNLRRLRNIVPHVQQNLRPPRLPQIPVGTGQRPIGALTHDDLPARTLRQFDIDQMHLVRTVVKRYLHLAPLLSGILALPRHFVAGSYIPACVKMAVTDWPGTTACIPVAFLR